MLNEKSIYTIQNSSHTREYIADMKTVMIKGVGYIYTSPKLKITPALFRYLADSMEDQGIKEV